MSWWKIKKKEITLDCYTHRADVYNYFPIVEAKNKIPDWFKKTPPSCFKGAKDHVKTIKGCPGLLEYWTKGFVLPLWSDLSIILEQEGKTGYEWQYSDLLSSIDVHDPEQTNNHFPETKYQHLKLLSPWLFVCSEDISFLAVEPAWQFDVLKNVRILTGVLNFKFQSGTHINMFCLREDKEKETILRSGTPLYNFIPLTEKKIKLKTHLISLDKFDRIKQSGMRTSFNRAYDTNKKLLQEKTCPFKFDTDT